MTTRELHYGRHTLKKSLGEGIMREPLSQRKSKPILEILKCERLRSLPSQVNIQVRAPVQGKAAMR